MEKEVKTENTVKKQKDHLFKKGQSGNPAGRPKDALNFKTKWIKFIEKIADQNNITPDEVDEQLLKVAYKQMQSGDFRYWKDIQDRVWGTATHNTDITTNGKDLLPDPDIQQKIEDTITKFLNDNSKS